MHRLHRRILCHIRHITNQPAVLNPDECLAQIITVLKQNTNCKRTTIFYFLQYVPRESSNILHNVN